MENDLHSIPSMFNEEMRKKETYKRIADKVLNKMKIGSANNADACNINIPIQCLLLFIVSGNR